MNVRRGRERNENVRRMGGVRKLDDKKEDRINMPSENGYTINWLDVKLTTRLKTTFTIHTPFSALKSLTFNNQNNKRTLYAKDSPVDRKNTQIM